jgi:hypothetical protein
MAGVSPHVGLKRGLHGGGKTEQPGHVVCGVLGKQALCGTGWIRASGDGVCSMLTSACRRTVLSALSRAASRAGSAIVRAVNQSKPTNGNSARTWAFSCLRDSMSVALTVAPDTPKGTVLARVLRDACTHWSAAPVWLAIIEHIKPEPPAVTVTKGTQTVSTVEYRAAFRPPPPALTLVCVAACPWILCMSSVTPLRASRSPRCLPRTASATSARCAPQLSASHLGPHILPCVFAGPESRTHGRRPVCCVRGGASP